MAADVKLGSNVIATWGREVATGRVVHLQHSANGQVYYDVELDDSHGPGYGAPTVWRRISTHGVQLIDMTDRQSVERWLDA